MVIKMIADFISINKKTSEPMYSQLYRELKAAIENGSIREGEKIPSIRKLCSDLGISKTTVETAYNLLGRLYRKPAEKRLLCREGHTRQQKTRRRQHRRNSRQAPLQVRLFGKRNRQELQQYQGVEKVRQGYPQQGISAEHLRRESGRSRPARRDRKVRLRHERRKHRRSARYCWLRLTDAHIHPMRNARRRQNGCNGEKFLPAGGAGFQGF